MEAQLRWWVVRTKHIISIWSLPHPAVHSWLRSRHMKKQRSTLYRKWASYGFHMRNTKIHNSYSEKIKSSYIVIEHTHCYHHTSQSQYWSFPLQVSLWHFVYLFIYMAFFDHYKIWLLITKLSPSYVSIR